MQIFTEHFNLKIINNMEHITNQTIKERIKTFAKYKGLGQGKFEAKCGLSNGYINNIRQSIQPDKLQKIALQFPDLNTGWLMTGEGEMLKTSPQPTEERSIDNTEGLHIVPLLPISAQGGSFNDFVTSIKENECEKVVSPVKGMDMAVTVAGDSMAPEYPSGCQVLIKKINDKAFIEWGKVYVLDTCNGTVIKEVHKGQNEDEIECHSINPDPKFQPFSVNRNDIYGMYRVIMCMSLK